MESPIVSQQAFDCFRSIIVVFIFVKDLSTYLLFMGIIKMKWQFFILLFQLSLPLILSCTKTSLLGDTDSMDFGIDTDDCYDCDTPFDFFEEECCDADVSSDIPEGIVDMCFDWLLADLDFLDSDWVGFPPSCGNGIIEGDEECDDKNRLNGDGCDWQCKVGDGNDPPSLNPDVRNYVLNGDYRALNDSEACIDEFDRIPLIWTGSEYATIFLSCIDSEEVEIRFRRFDMDTNTIFPDWKYCIPTPCLGMDLLWDGSNYYLFFSLDLHGVYFLVLNEFGIPIFGPSIIISDPFAEAIAVDFAPEGFVIVWLSSVDDTRYLMLSEVYYDGSLFGSSDPAILADNVVLTPDVACGSNGYGVTMNVSGYPDYPHFSNLFVFIDEDISEFVYSGFLSNGYGGDVIWFDGSYYSVWTHWEILGEPIEVCVSIFSRNGFLGGPPVCSMVTSEDNWLAPSAVHFSIGDNGIGASSTFVGDYPFFPLWFLRTDLNGVKLDSPVFFEPTRLTWPSAHAIVWANDRFSVLFHSPPSLWLQHIVQE